MKKLTAMVAALALFFTATATDPTPEFEPIALFNSSNSKAVKSEKVNVLIIDAFKESYGKNKDVSWRENKGIYFAYFTEAGKQLTASYNTDGELIATGKKLSIDDLTEATRNALYERYKDYNIQSEVSEITMNDETYFYLTVSNSKGSKILKCDSEGNISVFKNIKKKVLVGSVEV